MTTIPGDLIALAKAGEFEVIVHGCNCFCTIGAGIRAAHSVRWREGFAPSCLEPVLPASYLARITFCGAEMVPSLKVTCTIANSDSFGTVR